MSRERGTVGDRARARRWWILAVMSLSLVVISLSNTSLNVALPTLTQDLHTSPGALQWIVDAYSLVFAGCLLTAGAIGDRVGRRWALNVGLVIFAMASGLAAFSRSSGQLISARAVMGVGAALIMPATLSVLAHVFPPGERARAIAIWAGFAGAGGAAGSVVSGWLLQHFWWGSIFISNVVAVVVALIAGVVLVPSSRDDAPAGLDPLGAALSMLGLAALLFTIIEAPAMGWGSWRTLAGVGVSLGVLSSFVAWERVAREPMLDLQLFRNPSFVGATSTITLTFFVMYGTVFVLTQYLQLVLKYSTLEAGIRVLPLPIAFMASAPLSARLVEWWGQRRVVCSGLGLLAAGMGVLALSAATREYPMLGSGLVVAATGMGLTTAPSTGAIMAAVPLGKAGVASAVNDTTRELGGALGVAVLGSVLTSSFQAGFPSLKGRPVSLADALQIGVRMKGAARSGFEVLARRTFANAVDITLLAACCIALLAIAIVFRVLRPLRGEVAEFEPAAEEVMANRIPA